MEMKNVKLTKAKQNFLTCHVTIVHVISDVAFFTSKYVNFRSKMINDYEKK